MCNSWNAKAKKIKQQLHSSWPLIYSKLWRLLQIFGLFQISDFKILLQISNNSNNNNNSSGISSSSTTIHPNCTSTAMVDYFFLVLYGFLETKMNFVMDVLMWTYIQVPLPTSLIRIFRVGLAGFSVFLGFIILSAILFPFMVLLKCIQRFLLVRRMPTFQYSVIQHIATDERIVQFH